VKRTLGVREKAELCRVGGYPVVSTEHLEAEGVDDGRVVAHDDHDTRWRTRLDRSGRRDHADVHDGDTSGVARTVPGAARRFLGLTVQRPKVGC
jgi:hypothetical protein